MKGEEGTTQGPSLKPYGKGNTREMDVLKSSSRQYEWTYVLTMQF